jgi:predicted small lipoprotein YifL
MRSNLNSELKGTLSRALSFPAVALLLATLTACGGGGDSIQFPELQAASPEAAQQRKATATQAIEVTQSLRQAVTQAVASGQKLANVQETVNAQGIALPGGGSITEVRVEYGGTIVAEVNLPALPLTPATGPAPTSGPLVTPPAGTIESALPPTAAGRGQLVWVAYPVAEGVVRWYCFGSYASVAKDTDGACLYPGDSARGMTWGTANGPIAAGLPPYDAKFNMSYVDCNVTTPPTLGRNGGPKMCNPYEGDWHVLRKLPLLCVRLDGRGPPTGWLPAVGRSSLLRGEMAVTPPVYGIQLLGKVPGDAICSQQFGKDWTMANFHDAGGWGFWGAGRTPIDTRFWVRIRDTRANAWCGTLTGLPCNGDAEKTPPESVPLPPEFEELDPV